MLKKWLVVFVVIMLPVSLFATTTGKIAGVVKDQKTGELLPGANVTIVGTTLGAATDVNGEYVILNVPVGSYTVRATYIGYRSVEISNIRVHAGLTSEANFELPSEALELGAVEIVAERPLVNKNATNEIHIRTAEQIQNMPLRGYTNVAGLTGGVVQLGGTLYVRGGRSDEVAYYIDGVLQSDPINNARRGDLINNSIEEVQVQAGGFNAEFGFANSGIIQVTTKSGGPELNVSGEVITDEFLSKENDDFLSTFSYGYNLYNMAISGPVPGSEKVRYYIAGERLFMRDRSPRSAMHPAGADSVFDADGNFMYLEPKLAGGPLPNNALGRWNWNGNFTIDLRPLQFKIGGNSTRDDMRRYIHSFAMFNSRFNPRRTQKTDSYYIKATHTLGSHTFYTATASWFRTFTENTDFRFADNIEAYGDTTTNPYLRAPGNQPKTDARVAEFRPFGTTPGYSKGENSYIGLKADLTHQLGRIHEFKAGFEFRRSTVRNYSLSTMRLASARAANPDAPVESWYRSAFVRNIGYDIFGKKELDQGLEGARHPVVGAAYLQDKLEFKDLVLNLGLRFDYIDTDAPTFKGVLTTRDPTAPNEIVLTQGGTIDESQLGDSKTYSILSPRIGLSFPVTDRTVFHAQYGKFTQQPDFNRVLTGYLDLANNLQAGNFVTLENALLEPIKTTSYEIGFRQQLGDNAALDITAYYKELRDLIQARNLTINGTQFATFVNGDYGSVKGISATFELRRTQRVAAIASYTLQFAGGTGSAANDAFAINWLGNPPQYPTFVSPLAFDQRHTGNVNLDFRTTAQDGPIFGRLGVNLLFTFGSGTPYTPGHMRSAIFATGPAAQNRPQAEINSAYTPFTSQLDLKVDKSFSYGGIDFNAYVWVLNVLGTENVRFVYEQSGKPDTDGWLATPEGQSFASQTPTAADFYKARIANPFNWQSPRQIRLGVRFDWR